MRRCRWYLADHPSTFTPQLTNGQTITTDDLERDAVFEQRVRLFSWVRGYHLDVPENEATQGFLGFAEQELLKINHYKAPRDKMICILNCCKVIFGLIRHTAGSNATSADAFVPILIFVVLRAAPENMLSNIEYISRFRNAEKLQGEAGYYLSSLQGAIQFIETMDASSLSNITQEEFETNVEKAIQELPSSPSSPRARSSIPSGNNEISPWATTPGEEPARQLALPATAAALDGTKRFFQRTGDAAKEAVSRPLNTISKILQDMQQQATAESSSESGDDEVVDRWAPGGPRDRQHEHRAHHPHGSMPVAVPAPQYIHGRGEPVPPSHLLAQLGISPGDPTPRLVAWRLRLVWLLTRTQWHTPRTDTRLRRADAPHARGEPRRVCARAGACCKRHDFASDVPGPRRGDCRRGALLLWRRPRARY